jgi:hypothetical protein
MFVILTDMYAEIHSNLSKLHQNLKINKMKNILITASILFAFSGAFAQEKGTKNIKPVKAPSSSTRPMSSEVESFKKDNGTVKPIKGNGVNTVKPIKGNSSSTAPSKTTTIRPQKSAAGNSTRAASGSRVNTMKAEKPASNNTRAASGSRVNTMKAEKPASNNSRAAAGSKVNTMKAEKPASNNSRAAAGSNVNTMKAEKPSINNTKNNTVVEKGEKGNSEAKGERPSSKFDADYCKGWKDGFSKAYAKGTKEKLESSDIPRCENNGKCEGYKCGYEAGMNKAELMLR